MRRDGKLAEKEAGMCRSLLLAVAEGGKMRDERRVRSFFVLLAFGQWVAVGLARGAIGAM